MYRQPLAVGAAGGSLASFLLRLAADTFTQDHPFIADTLESCVCPALIYPSIDLDTKSVIIGIFIGLILGPLLELLVLVRQWWAQLVRHNLVALARSRAPLYKDR